MIEAARPGTVGPSRREFVALGIGAFVVATLPVGLRRRGPELVRRTVPVMGTLADIAVQHRDRRYAQAAIDAAIDQLRWVDRSMTRFTDVSDVGRANLRAASEAVLVSPETAQVLEQALRWAEASDGAFDPCLGRAIVLWDVAHRREPPAPQQVESLARRRLYRALEVDRWRGAPAVRFHDADVAIDLGGIAKGYGVDRAIDALRAYGIRNGLVNVGGDLYALGVSEDGDPWKVGIQLPDDPQRLTETLEVEDAAVATSGDYVQYFLHGGRRYHHMLDPQTGEPKRSPMRSVTIVSDTCMEADAAGTAVFGMAQRQARELLASCAPRARIAKLI